MEYNKHYNNLISSRLELQPYRRVKKQAGEYFEVHHIQPRCLGGDDSKHNLILLTGREHYIAHLFLWKIHGGKLFYAVWRMTHPLTTSGVGAKITSRRFDYLRKQQQNNNRRYGEHHWNYGKQHSMEAREKMRLAKLGKTSPRKGKRLTDETKEKLRKANIGKVLSKEHKDNISKGMKQSSHPILAQVQPFQHIKICNNVQLKHNWREADKIYTIWLNSNKPGETRLGHLTNIRKYQLRKMIDWFKKFGNPRFNKEWVVWENNT